MLLHTVSKSPWDSEALCSCLRVALPGSVILLVEDGVYAASAGCEAAQNIAALADIRCFALAPDIKARGLEQRLDANIEAASFDDFVRLSTECHAVQSWY
jgi:tRNA 2-thiouridine synthesizing protein B